MKITQEVRDYAADLEAKNIKIGELDSQVNPDAGMAEKSAEFREKGSEIYHQAK